MFSERIYLNDITIYRGGLECAWKEWLKFRGGIARRPRPTPTMASSQNWMDFDRMIYTLGVSFIVPALIAF